VNKNFYKRISAPLPARPSLRAGGFLIEGRAVAPDPPRGAPMSWGMLSFASLSTLTTRWSPTPVCAGLPIAATPEMLLWFCKPDRWPRPPRGAVEV